ncbi:hypothetical protein [Ekhidna sp.]|uniref:hypothetical protein n=1 Tax=Ekhidna sp. TaxID=2608089 RepID=UPI0032EBB871
MAKRTDNSPHDNAVRALKKIYEKHGYHVWINPGSEKNKSWSGKWIDVIVADSEKATKAKLFEIETSDSIDDDEAMQWKEYDKAYTTVWHLAIPEGSKADVEKLIKSHKIERCKIVTWTKKADGTHSFKGLPGTKK